MELLYHGKPMVAEMRALDADYEMIQGYENIRACILGGCSAHISLEPGDCSRYDFVIAPLGSPSGQPGIAIVRTRGGHAVACADLWDWTTGASSFQISDAAAKLGLGDDWSTQIMTWWLSGLCAPDA